MKEHPTPNELEALVLPALGVAEREGLMEHLVECEDCFTTYERLWAQVARELPELSALSLDPLGAQRVEARLFRRIHVASLASASAWLVTEGFLRTILGVLLPIVELGRLPALSERRGTP